MSTCESGNDYDGRMGARISSVFVILVTSLFGNNNNHPNVAFTTNNVQVPYLLSSRDVYTTVVE